MGAIVLAAVAPSPAPTTCCSSHRRPTRAPIGWVEFCAEHPFECKVTQSAPRDVVLSNKAWADLTRINRWVNENVTPMTDLEHWGLVEVVVSRRRIRRLRGLCAASNGAC